MAVYLHSADPGDACQAVGLGFVRDITTNPRLLATVKRSSGEVLRELFHVCPGNASYHVSAPLPVLVAMGHDPLSERAAADFAQAASQTQSE